ncbi:hypothetical protein ACUODJ_43630, partial [Escherichia sp. HC-CC]
MTAYNSGHMNVINTIFNALPTLFNTFKFDKKNMKPLLLANNSNEYPGLFSAIQHKQQNVVETVYLALSDHARQLGIGTVYQEVNLLPNMSVADNLFI